MILVQVRVPFSCCVGKGLSCCVSKGIVPRPCACMHRQLSGKRKTGWLRLRPVQASSSLHGLATLPLQLTASCVLPPRSAHVFICSPTTAPRLLPQGTKFNTRMEDVRGENYLGIKIFRWVC